MIKKQSLDNLLQEVKEIVFCPLTTYCVTGCPAKVVWWIVKTKKRLFDCTISKVFLCNTVWKWQELYCTSLHYYIAISTILAIIDILLPLQQIFRFLCVKLCTKHVSHWYTKVIQLEVFFSKLLLVLISPTTYSRDSVVLNAINQSKSKLQNDR